MAIVNGVTVAAKLAFLRGEMQPGDDYYLALYTSSAVLSPMTESYTTAGEVKAAGYKAGGLPLTGIEFGINGVTACMTWSRPLVWPNSNITAHGCMIYNRTRGGLALAVNDFGMDYTSTNGSFKLTLPSLTSGVTMVMMS